MPGVGQKMSNGILQPFVFRLLLIPEEYIPKRPRSIKVTETINPTRYKATSQVQGGLKRRRKRKYTTSAKTTKPPRNIRETERNSMLVDLRRNTSKSSKRHTPRARPERKSAIAGLCRAQAVLAMEEVEGGTRLAGDALSGRVDASKNRIPKWKLYQGAVLLGRTGGMRLRSQAKKRDEGKGNPTSRCVTASPMGIVSIDMNFG